MVRSYEVKEIQVPELSFYSELDWAEVSQGSSAVALYRSWLDRSDANSEMASLRLDRHRAWLRAALATFFDNAATSHVVEFWSYSADKLISEAWRACGLGDLPVALIALGKLGAEELCHFYFVRLWSPFEELDCSACKYKSKKFKLI